MILFVLKCRDGYLKNTSNGIDCVSIEKATVFSNVSTKIATDLINSAKALGLPDLRLAELIISEKDNIEKF